jgi:hypothetical protein
MKQQKNKKVSINFFKYAFHLKDLLSSYSDVINLVLTLLKFREVSFKGFHEKTDVIMTWNVSFGLN